MNFAFADIMINLLTNAVKYTEEGRITLRAAAEKTGEEQILFKLEIEDTGAGIKQEDLQKLFESFTRIDEKQNRNIEGTGLGLSITKRLLDLMHGTISVESEYGKGSIFRVEIPQKVLSWEAMGPFRAGFTTQTKVKTDEEEESLWLPEARILVVDDVPMNIKVFTLLLKDTGMQIDTALSGEECLKMTAQKQYNMIFLDHMMPEMDGIEVLHRIQQNEENKNREVPIIALTANAIVGVREKYLKEGFWDYLSKPVKLSGLKKMLLKYLQPELAKIPTASVKAEQKTDGEKTFLEQLDFPDVQKGLSYCADDEDFYKEMLKMYSDNSRLIELKKQYDEKDWENYRIQVHALKSTSLSIGAVKLSEQAKEMEEAAKNGCVEELSEQQEKMMKEYEKLLGRLKEVL